MGERAHLDRLRGRGPPKRQGGRDGGRCVCVCPRSGGDGGGVANKGGHEERQPIWKKKFVVG